MAPVSREDRLSIIKEIEDIRGSKVLTYFTGDRKGLESRIASDVFPFILRHLQKMGSTEKIDLFIYSTGGVTMAGYGLVNMIRAYCKSFNVIIPFKALSCATLISLGADEILMTKMGQFSPIDPSITSPLGPFLEIPNRPNATRPIPLNVEDVIGYLDLARQEIKSEDPAILARVFDRLSQSVHPLALGAVQRRREQIAFLASTLLDSHMDDPTRIESIVETLIRGRYSHDYLISYSEAKNIIGLPIADLDPYLESKIIELYNAYDSILDLSVPYTQESALGAETKATVSFIQAVIESDDLTYLFRSVKQLERVTIVPPQVPVTVTGYNEITLSARWEEDDSV